MHLASRQLRRYIARLLAAACGLLSSGGHFLHHLAGLHHDHVAHKLACVTASEAAGGVGSQDCFVCRYLSQPSTHAAADLSPRGPVAMECVRLAASTDAPAALLVLYLARAPPLI